MDELQLFHYKYCEESKQFKKSKTNNDTSKCLQELIYIAEYLNDNSIEYEVNENLNIQLNEIIL